MKKITLLLVSSLFAVSSFAAEVAPTVAKTPTVASKVKAHAHKAHAHKVHARKAPVAK